MKNLFKALAEFQNAVPIIHEDTKGYNYTYANLNSIFKVIKPLLKKYKLGFTQMLDGDKLKTIIYHIDSGESIESSVTMPIADLKGMNVYQSMGSAITYFRRYSLSCALGLITDKDIDAAGEQTPKKTMLTDDQFNKAMQSDVKGIEATLKAFKGRMTKEQEKALKKQSADILEQNINKLDNVLNPE
jgi:hypothetical protein